MTEARERINEKLDVVFSWLDKYYLTLVKLNYKYFFIFAMLIPVGLVLISISLYSLTEPFSIFTHYLSDLGIGPNGSGIVFSIAMFTASIAIFLLSVFLFQLLQKAGGDPLKVMICLCSSTLTAISVFFIGVFPTVYMQIVHNVFASILFYGMLITTISLILIEWKMPALPKILPISTIILVVVNSVFTVFTFLRDFNIGDFETEVRFMEWMTAFAGVIWILIHDLYTFTPRIKNIIKMKYKI